MDTLTAKLPKDIEELEIKLFADEHLGDPLSDEQRLKDRISYVQNHKDAYCILNGDLVDNATRKSIGDVYAQEFTPMEQLERAVDLFQPISHKILCVTQGNHEYRSYKDAGINMSRLIAVQLGIEDRFVNEGVLLFIHFGTKKRKASTSLQCYTIYVTHGRGGGRKEGAKAIRLADMASIVDADVYVHSHTHLPMVMKKSYFRTNYGNKSTSQVTRLFVNTASNLNYGGYGQVQEYSPNSKDTPTIYLLAKDRRAEARL